MKDLIDIYQQTLVIGCMVGLAILAAAILMHVCGRSMLAIRRALSARDLAVFALVACVFCWAAQKRRVSFPRTDPTQAYLTDRGSWVDGDLVHIDFVRIIVPDSAMMYVDRRNLSDTSITWENHLSAPFGEIRIPLEFEHPSATNYDWIVYTDWTPGPAVQTNGVWHANWGRDRRTGVHMIPLRTAVRVNGDTIATPKSKEDAQNE